MALTAEPADHSPPDATVIEDSLQEPEEFAVIFHRYFTEIHRYIARRVGVPFADDAAAEVFLTAFAQRQRFDLAYPSARPWLYGIATNIVGAHLRRERRFYRMVGRGEARGAAASEEEEITDRLTAAAVRPAITSALAMLGRGERDVLLLVALADLSYEEVAQALGIRYGTVCSRLNRARKRLRAALGGANPAGDVMELPHAHCRRTHCTAGAHSCPACCWPVRCWPRERSRLRQ